MPHALVAVETRHTKGGSMSGGATLIPSSEPATRRLHERRVNTTMCREYGTETDKERNPGAIAGCHSIRGSG